MMNLSEKIFITVIIGLFLVSCNSPQAPSEKEEKQSASVRFPSFSGDSAYYFVEKQVSFGPRVPNTSAHRACAVWMETRLRQFSSHVVVQNFKARAFNGEVLNGRNLIISFRPDVKKRILLGAHWDSRPWADHDPEPGNHQKPIDGANDGASGAGVLMELARLMSSTPPPIGVDIILFDAEDYGPPRDLQNADSEEAWGLGSQYWSRNPHVMNYRAQYGILLDMVGVPEPVFLMEGFSMYYAPHIVKKVWSIAEGLGYGKSFPTEKGGYITDDHYFVNKIAGIPMINIIHLERDNAQNTFFRYWHTLQDNMEHIDKESLQMVGEVVVRVVYNP